MKKKAPEVREQPKKVYWNAIQINQNCNRVFKANAIRFQNQGDQSNVVINDTQFLNWAVNQNGDTFELNSQLNEIDSTAYKIQFYPQNPVFINNLVIWIKQDTMQEEPILEVIKPKDRRQVAADRDILRSKKRR